MQTGHYLNETQMAVSEQIWHWGLGKPLRLSPDQSSPEDNVRDLKGGADNRVLPKKCSTKLLTKQR